MKGFFLREEKSIEGCSFTLTLKPTKTCDFHYQAVASFVDNKLTVTPLDHFDFISFTMEFTEEGILEVSEHCLQLYTCTHVYTHNLFNIRLAWLVASRLQDSTEDCNLLLLN